VRYGSGPQNSGDTPQDNHVNNGDINNDTRVDVVDVLLSTRMALGLYQPADPLEWIRADMAPDPLYPTGLINAGDLMRIRKAAMQAQP